MSHELTRLKREAWWKLVGHSDVKKATKDATNSDPWGPSIEQLKGLSEACYISEDRAQVMHNLWKRIEDKEPKNWRKIAKALVCIDYVMLHGPEDVVLEVRSGAYRLKPLRQFQYEDEKTDHGKSVRTKVEKVLELIKNDELIQQARATARRTAQRITGTSSSRPCTSPMTTSPTLSPTNQELTDEELARKLHNQFVREARQAGLTPPSRPVERVVNIESVDIEEQRKIMEQIRSSSDGKGVQGRVSPPPAGRGYTSAAPGAWSIAPPPSGASQPNRTSSPQPQVTPPPVQLQQQQPVVQQQQAPPAASDAFDPFAPAQAQNQPRPQQQALFSQQQQQEQVFFPPPQQEKPFEQPQQQVFYQQEQQSVPFVQQQPQQPQQQQVFYPQEPLSGSVPLVAQQQQPQQQQPQQPFDPFAPVPPAPVQEKPPEKFEDFFTGPTQQQQQTAAVTPPAPAPAPNTSLPPAPAAEVPEKEKELSGKDEPGFLEKKLMADLDHFTSGTRHRESPPATLSQLATMHPHSQQQLHQSEGFADPQQQQQQLQFPMSAPPQSFNGPAFQS